MADTDITAEDRKNKVLPFTRGAISIKDNGSIDASNQAIVPGTDMMGFTNSRYEDELNAALASVAAGGYSNQMQTFLVGLDRFQRNLLPPNSEHSGLTFITRPRLNLQSSSIRQDRTFAPLDIDGSTIGSRSSMGYMIKCLLDTKFCNSAKHGDGNSYLSPLLNVRNPFMTPLCNGLTGISGFPDPVIQTLTTDAGFHSEDQTFAIGYDDLNRTYDLSLSFKDIQHGPIAAIFTYWIKYIANVTKGTMLAYSDDIDNRRLNYTVSIYRFVLDPSRRFITKYAKATGCFPKSIPLGAMFNYSEGELYVSSSGKFTIPFVANKIEYNDYAILSDFNYLVKRYCPNIEKLETIPPLAQYNYMGVPFIETFRGQPEIVFKLTDDEIQK